MLKQNSEVGLEQHDLIILIITIIMIIIIKSYFSRMTTSVIKTAINKDRFQ